MSAPVLKHPEEDKLFILSTDASSVDIGAVLEQFIQDEELRPIAYYSRNLQTAKKNYQNYELEALAVVTEIKHFRPYLLGRHVIVYTDNSAVASLFKEKDSYGRIIRWVNFLLEFNCEIKHRAEKENVVADYLSRPGADVLMAQPKSYNQQQDKSLTEIKQIMFTGILDDKINNPKNKRQLKTFILIKEKSYKKKKDQIYEVLETIGDLDKVLNTEHNGMGHLDSGYVWPWIRSRYWRPKLYTEVHNYIRSCQRCQEFAERLPLYKFDGKSKLSSIFKNWVIDFLGPFPELQANNRYTVIMIETLTGFPFTEAKPDTTAISAIEVVWKAFSIFGIPDSVTVDR
ncbi:Transposon Ty3-G Gag-Pol polyprotein [Smittium culicis]|uniref:Transposon Ty3-G Gag-Pol polyprotein n=1 Tax=Smittium culicis TaxID=133412 RepID=A0A1R1YET3_9FUNG|nr:Transposon Ty3-G Gag-Pol polyprotein [Smittium culicis]